jgi:hypothetical protein
MSLVGGVLVIVTGCAAELSDPVPEARAPQAATETDASDAWQGVRLEGMTVDRSNPVRRGGAGGSVGRAGRRQHRPVGRLGARC